MASNNHSYDDPNCSEEEEEDYFSDIVDLQLKKHYTVLNEEEIKQRQNEDITEVSTVLSISRKAATTLLCSFKWSDSEFLDTLFANEDQVLKSVGLVPDEETDEESEEEETDEETDDEGGGGGRVTCNICFSRRRIEKCVSAVCGHCFYKECYSNYIRISIDDGIGCLLLRCPKPNCKVVVDDDLINSLKELPDEHKAKYETFLLRSYVEQSRTRKWCPGPGCKNAVEFTDIHRKNWDVVCDCSLEFCWNCSEEAHSPVDCATVVEWEKKKSSESENVSYILAYTKPCPKFKSPIEKNLGCDHMTCRRHCGHEFCWLCLGDWKKHKRISCNAYRSLVKGGMIRKSAQSTIQRYAHYFERWNGNQRSRDIARTDLGKFRNVDREKLFDSYKERIRSLGGIEAGPALSMCRKCTAQGLQIVGA